jgi:hypothetical protein
MKDDIGENPVHFLDRDLPTHPNRVASDHGLPRMIQDRIDGIDRLEVIGAWRAAERQLRRGDDIQALPDEVDPDDVDFFEHDIEPGRRRVLNALDERKQYLLEHGERPREFRTYHRHELPERYQPHDRTVPPANWYWIDEDGERVPWSQRPTAVSTTRRFNSSTGSDAVATDGGEQE